MESELRKLLENVDKAMSAAESLKKAVNSGEFLEFNRAVYFIFRDDYSKALESMHGMSNSICKEAGEFSVPLELINMVSGGLRTDEFNLKTKENAESLIKNAKNQANSYEIFAKNIESVFQT